MLSAIGNGVNYSELLQGYSQKYDLDCKTCEQDLKEVLQYALQNRIIKEVKP